MWGSSAPLLGAAIAAARGAPILFVCTHLDDADAVADDLEVLTGFSTELFPAWELDIDNPAGAASIPYDHVSDEIVGERLRVCNLLATEKRGRESFPGGDRKSFSDSGPAERKTTPDPFFLVAPVGALMQPVPMPEALAAARLRIEKGRQLAPEELAAWLLDAGLDPVEQIEQPGEFCRRGGILDVFIAGATCPVRVEFFGDEVESIRRFDLDTQRSTEEIDGYELVGTAAGRETDPAVTTSLLEYLPDDTIVCIIDPAEVRALADTLHRRMWLATGGDRRVSDDVPGMREPAAVFGAMGRLAMVETHSLRSVDAADGSPVVAFDTDSLHRLETRAEEALDELEKLAVGHEVHLYCENPAERDRFGEMLASTHPELAGKIHTGIGHVHRGFVWPAEKLVVVGHHEVFHRYARPRRIRRIRSGRPIDSFVDLQDGDTVVHVGHGIARFEGLKHLEKEGRTEEYLSLRFAKGALLHVPVTDIHLVQKYVGARRARPTLSHLGSTAWSARKQRVAEAVKDLAAELLRVQAVRASSPGVRYAGDSEWLRRFEEEFLYTETEDQITSMKQIATDMAEPRPMDRLLCGDVGFGKTELAMRAAFRVVEDGKQAAVLVPTTVLADQHFRTFTERFADYPFHVDVISRFRTKADQARVADAVAGGRIDILIGTHRMLSGDIRFKDIGLVVIDEEQRFGVEHKEALKRMRASVDVLTMTATPIPRTLHMTLMGLRDISNLTTPPLDRRAIYTEVCHENDDRIRGAILREMNRGGQAFFVHNRVMNIRSVADRVRGLVPEARVAVGHGQMAERELENTMLRFVRGEIDVLVCTTIIESGLDIPTANTMFVHEAYRLGLAQLHQLRGRIGRYKHRAYCYLMLPRRRPVSREAARRLKAVEEFSDLGAGFQIAMRDLEIRGACNILGPEQSGHIAAVGYELYCQLLEHAVGRLRGDEPGPAPRAVHVELGVDAYIPRSYIASARQRMEAYRRLSHCADEASLDQLAADLADAYGSVPPVVDTLLALRRIRVLAGGFGIDSIVAMPPDIIFSLGDPAAADKALVGLRGSVRLPDERTAHWRPPPNYFEGPTLLTVLRRHLQAAAGTL